MVQQAKEVREGIGGTSVEAEAEIVIAEVTGVNTGAGHNTVFLEGAAIITASAGATELTLRLRRASLTGTEVEKQVVTLVKSAKQEISIQGEDSPGVEFANATYVLTAQSAAAEKQKSVSSRLTATF